VWSNNQSNDYGFFVPAAHFLICPPLAKNSLTALFNKYLSGFAFFCVGYHKGLFVRLIVFAFIASMSVTTDRPLPQ
jgi:hypothetical protein